MTTVITELTHLIHSTVDLAGIAHSPPIAPAKPDPDVMAGVLWYPLGLITSSAGAVLALIFSGQAAFHLAFGEEDHYYHRGRRRPWSRLALWAGVTAALVVAVVVLCISYVDPGPLEDAARIVAKVCVIGGAGAGFAGWWYVVPYRSRHRW